MKYININLRAQKIGNSLSYQQCCAFINKLNEK